ncbi:MAG: hypothetical protein JWN98_2359 [Abditibacteriota bacterium]|nr:hypothetical protein [Abditibacteriota bacterium]
MPFTIDRVVPWGRAADEYTRLFALSDTDLTRRILGCADGPASFNAQATGTGAKVLSLDPIYAFSASEIETRVQQTHEQILSGVRSNQADFIWESSRSLVASPEELSARRMAAMQRFLHDLPDGAHQGRYVAAALPDLPLRDSSFDLALSSHFLFLYSEHLGLEFHRRALREMLRVASEARIFPLLQMGGTPSPLVQPIIEGLWREGYTAERIEVPYEFQRGGKHMLRIARKDIT